MVSHVQLVLVYCIILISLVTSKCIFVPRLYLIDCSSMELNSVPRFSLAGAVINYRSLTLRWNNISFVNITQVKHDLPSIIVVNLRNNPLICNRYVCLSSRVVIKSDCNCSLIAEKSRSSLQPSTRDDISAKFTEKIVVPPTITTEGRPMVPTTNTNTGATSTPMTNNKTIITQFSFTIVAGQSNLSYEVVYIVIPTVGILMLIILCSIIVRKKYIKKKRYTRLEQLELEIIDIDGVNDENDEVLVYEKSYMQKSHSD